MRKLDQIRLRIRSLFHRRDVDRELEDEVRFHLDQLVEENVAAGMAQEEARWKALRSMGGVTKFQEECRDMRKVNLVEDFSRDMLYACRSLRRSPGFAALAVSIMALGIGANTAVFSVVKRSTLETACLSRSRSDCDPFQRFNHGRGISFTHKAGVHPEFSGLARSEFLIPSNGLLHVA